MNFFTAPSAATCSCDSSAAFSALVERVDKLERYTDFDMFLWLVVVLLLLLVHSMNNTDREIIKVIREIEEDLARLNRRG